ncbi:MAG: hypothetical protein ACYS9H_01880 [Planctomycetota bacterium]
MMGTNAKTWGLRIICVIFMLWGLASIAQANLIASYETSETSLVVTTPDLTLTPTIVAGNTAGAPVATEGTRVLKCTWTNQPDNKVEVKHAGLNFDLAGFNLYNHRLVRGFFQWCDRDLERLLGARLAGGDLDPSRRKPVAHIGH